MSLGEIHGIYTLLFMLVFIAMAIWVFLPRRKKNYDEVSSLPMQDTDDARDAGSNNADKSRKQD